MAESVGHRRYPEPGFQHLFFRKSPRDSSPGWTRLSLLQYTMPGSGVWLASESQYNTASLDNLLVPISCPGNHFVDSCEHDFLTPARLHFDFLQWFDNVA